MTNSPSPFGAPGFSTRPNSTRVPTEECASPATFHRRLRSRNATAEPSCLLETSEGARPTASRSIVTTRCPLRVELSGDEARVIPLSPDAEPLVERLTERFELIPGARSVSRVDGVLTARFTPASRDPELDDAERLKSPCVLDALRSVAGLVADDASEGTDGDPAMAPGLFGAFSYEIVDRFEDLPPRKPDPLGEPDASFLLATDVVVFEHDRGDVHVISRQFEFEERTDAQARHARILDLLAKDGPADPIATVVQDTAAPATNTDDPVPDVSGATFRRGVVDLKEQIAEGEIFQAVLSRGFAMRSPACSLDVYAALRRSNPSPYMFHLDLGEGQLLGASPETFLRCERGDVEIRPIAGTVQRGTDEEMDGRLALQLLFDTKEQAEHAMLLDLARNDIARVSAPGTCRVVQQLEVERYSHVQHLVSRVRGSLRDDLDALHAFRAAANMGTLTGAPKLRAMELIRFAEPQSRGFYGGAAGYLLQDGSFDSCIVIRSLRVKDGTYFTRAGAGIVQGSDPEREFQETASKARACIEAVRAATQSASSALHGEFAS